MEDSLACLRKDGASSVQAIVALHDVLGLSLAESKQRFSESPAWAAEVAAGDALHAGLEEAIKNAP